MSRIPRNENHIEVKQSYNSNISTTVGSFSRTLGSTEECPLNVALVARCHRTELSQFREYVRDDNVPYNGVELNRECVIIYTNRLYITHVLHKRALKWCNWYIYHPGTTWLAKNYTACLQFS